MTDDLKARAARLRDDVGNIYEQTIGQLADALDARDQRIAELEAELRERDDQDELWRLVKVWRTRADKEFQRAERAEAAYERTHAQANDALNRAAELQQHADQLQAALDQAQGRVSELERQLENKTAQHRFAKHSAEVAETENARLRNSLGQVTQINTRSQRALESMKNIARTALAQQTDQQEDN